MPSCKRKHRLTPFRLSAGLSALILAYGLALPATLSAQQTGLAAATDVARENRLRSESLIANAVDVGTGAFVYEQSLMTLPGLRPLDLTISHNSLLTGRRGVLGPGWTHQYEAFIDPAPSGIVTVHWNALTQNRFDFDGEFVGLEPASQYDQLTRDGAEWNVTTLDGTKYEFNAEGRLARVSNKVNQGLDLTYVDDLLRKVREPFSDREIEFFYNGGDCIESPFTSVECPVRLHLVRDQADRIVVFEYDQRASLATVWDPATLAPERFPQFSNTALTPIPDNDPDGLLSTVNVNRTEPIGLVFLSSFLINHDRPSDLIVGITSPSGTVATLTTAGEGPAWNLANTALGDFNGEDPNGTWSIRIVDRVAGTEGTLSGFSLQFTEPANPYSITSNNRFQLARMDDPEGRQIFANGYDAQGRLVSQDDGRNGNPIEMFRYVEGAGGVTTTYTDRLGATTIFEHDRRYNLMKITDALGGETTYQYDVRSNRTAIRDALGRTTRFEYDQEGNLTSTTDPAGGVTRFTYDQFGRRNLMRVEDPLGNATSYQYDNNNNIRAMTDAAGNRDTKTYGGNSQPIDNLLEDGGGINYTHSGGLLTGISHPVDGNTGANYDAIGLLSEITDGDGFTRKTVYNSRGDAIQKTDPAGNVSRSFYDRRGRKVRTLAPNGGTTRLEYDGNDNIVAVTDAMGGVTRYEYDGDDRIVKIVDPLGGERIFEYDVLGRVIAETDELGERTRTEYDAVGNVVAVYNAQGVRVEATVYDERDLPIQTTDALGGAYQSSYDAGGRLIRTIDPLGRETVYEYDELDRETAAEDPLGRRSTRNYLSDDMTSRLESPGGFRTDFGYDPANRMTSVTYPWFRSIRLRYNRRDLVNRIEMPSGRRFDFSYGANGLVEEIDRSGNPLESDSTTTFRYDESDNVEQIASGGNQTARYRYDVLQRLTNYVDLRGDSIGYAYDEAGRLTRMTYPDGNAVQYRYDAAGQLTEVEDWAGRITRYEYDANGDITRVALPNGTRREMTYDKAGRLTSRRDLDAQGTVIVAYGYEYDASGAVRVESSGAGLAPYRQRPTTFAYRQSGGLLEMFNGEAVTHDFDGNVTGVGNRSYTWFQTGSLRTLSAPGLGEIRMRYDSEDRLVEMGSTRLTVDPSQGVERVLVSRNGSARTRYVWGVGLIYEETPGGIRVHHYDYRGSTVALSDGSGNVVGRASYGPYGETGDTMGEMSSLFGFNALFGVITGPDGLLHMRYRWYSPELKQFLSPDAQYGEIGEPSTLNLFAFAGNNPVNRIDANGQIFNAIGAAIGAVGGAVVGVVTQGVTDLITGKTPQWEDYAAAAIGGFVGGGILGACLGTCGPVALAAAGAVAGAVDGALGPAVGSWLRGEEPDVAEVVTGAVVGGALGGLTGGVGGKVAGKAGKLRKVGGTGRRVSRARPQPIRVKTSPVKRVDSIDTLPTARGGVGRRSARVGSPERTGNDLLVRQGKTTAGSGTRARPSTSRGPGLRAGATKGSASAVRPKGPSVNSNDQVLNAGRRAVNARRGGRSGARHVRFRDDVLGAAGRRTPNRPNQTGTF